MGLKRVLGSVDAGWLVAGNMIGAGIFYTPGLVAGSLPGFWPPLGAWLAGGLLALFGAAVYAELGCRLPRAGGDYQYLAAAFGPMWGFLTGWAALLLTFSAAAAAMSLVAIDYLHAAAPATAAIPRWVAAPACIVALTAANVVGARFGGKTTALFTAVPLIGLAVLFGLGLASGRTTPAWPASTGQAMDSWPLAAGAAMLPVYFTYSGWNAAAYLAGELRDPARDLARGLIGGTLFVSAIYVAVNALFLVVIPQDQLAGSVTAGAQAARLLLGPGAEQALSACIAVAVLGSCNVTLMAGARIYYAMAGDGLAPAALGRTNNAGVPSAALWAGGVWTALLATTARVEVLVSWATLAILLLSSMAVAALFVLRRRDPRPAAFRCPGYPWVPAIYLLVSLAVAAASAIRDWQQSLYGMLIVAVGLPVYALARRTFRRETRTDGP